MAGRDLLCRLTGLGLLFAAVLLGATEPVAAQSWFDNLFQPFRAAPPPRAPAYAYPPVRRRPPRPRPHVSADRMPDRPAEKTPHEVTVPVAVLGDSLGQLLGLGLGEELADKPQVGVLRRARENTGLTRDDVFDWVRGAREIADGADRPKLAIMLIGSNDRQPLRDGDATLEPFSPRWLEIYRLRVAAVLAAFKARGIPLIWVGLPVPRSERLAGDFSRLNDIYREEAAKTGATFVDIWEAFSDERGQYAAVGPGLDGQVARLRTADGVNFTRAGTLKLAHFVGGEVRRDLEGTGGDTPVATVPPHQDEPPTAATPITAPAKPVAGPILSLTAAPAATGGLAQRGGAVAGDNAVVLAHGQAPDSHARELPP